MAINEEALKHCKFYKGEDECPLAFQVADNRSAFFWMCEQFYANIAGRPTESKLIERFLDAGLAGLDYDLPLGLQAAIFALYCKDADDPDDVCAAYFKDSVYPDYLHLTSIMV